MKKLFNYILIGVFASLVLACDDNEYEEFDGGKFEYVGINTSPLPASIFEGNGASSSSLNVTVRYGNEVSPGRDITVNISLAGTAALGTDFSITGANNLTAAGFSVTIPGDTSVTSFTITTLTNVDLQEDRTIEMEITGTSDDVSLGFPYSAAYTLVIEDDDCAYDINDFVGAAQVTEVYSAESTYGPYDPVVSSPGANALRLDNFWDWGWGADITINPTDFSVTFEADAGGAAALIGATGANDWTGVGTGVLSTCSNTVFLEITVSSASFGYEATFAYDITY